MACAGVRSTKVAISMLRIEAQTQDEMKKLSWKVKKPG
jgi:hypothetical protein